MPRSPTRNSSAAGQYILLETVPAVKSECVVELWSELKRSRSSGLKRHACSRCGKVFTSSGHLKRHFYTHTGEKPHRCPFPGCETRCSRHDNLQQHYKTHLPTSVPLRKVAKARKHTALPTPTLIPDLHPVEQTPLLPSIDSPPPLEEAYSSQSSEYSSYSTFSSPLQTPPEPVQVTLPVSHELHQVSIIPPSLFRSRSRGFDHPKPSGDKYVQDGVFIHYKRCEDSKPTCPPLWIPDPAPPTVPPCISLAHPIPRPCQPRSPLLDNPPDYELEKACPPVQRPLQDADRHEQHYAPTMYTSSPASSQESSGLLSPLELPTYGQQPFGHFHQPSYHLVSQHTPIALHFQYYSQFDQSPAAYAQPEPRAEEYGHQAYGYAN